MSDSKVVVTDLSDDGVFKKPFTDPALENLEPQTENNAAMDLATKSKPGLRPNVITGAISELQENSGDPEPDIKKSDTIESAKTEEKRAIDVVVTGETILIKDMNIIAEADSNGTLDPANPENLNNGEGDSETVTAIAEEAPTEVAPTAQPEKVNAIPADDDFEDDTEMIDDIPDIAAFLGKWSQTHNIPIPALSALLQFLRLFTSMEYLPENGESFLASLSVDNTDVEDSDCSPLFHFLETKFDGLTNKIQTIENNQSALMNSMKLLTDNIFTAPPLKRAKLFTNLCELNTNCSKVEPTAGHVATFPLKTVEEITQFNEMLEQESYFKEMVEKLNVDGVASRPNLMSKIFCVMDQLVTADLAVKHFVKARENFLNSTKKAMFSNYMNIILLIQAVVNLNAESPGPGTVYRGIHTYLKRAGQKRTHAECN